MHDPRIGRFFTIDPLKAKFPHNSSYAFSENVVISSIELEGGEKLNVSTSGHPMPDGTPGEATITVTKDYMIVDNGIGCVNIDEHEPEVFHDIYVKGNYTLFMKELPTPSKEGIFLTGDFNKWAKKAYESESASKRLRNKNRLIEANVQYYNTKINYEYNIVGSGDLVTVARWMNEDKSNRGMIMTPLFNEIIPNTSLQNKINEFINLGLSEDNAKSFVFGTKSFNINASKTKLLGFGLSEGDDLIFLTPKYFGANGTGYSKIHINKILVHEGGHNSAIIHKHTKEKTGDYEYHQRGLQNKENPYPTINNTKNIINDKKNRSTIPDN